MDQRGDFRRGDTEAVFVLFMCKTLLEPGLQVKKRESYGAAFQEFQTTAPDVMP
jgi:hypothetical protein